jgi:uncharacterized protein YjbJ (UPF0337 family)
MVHTYNNNQSYHYPAYDDKHRLHAPQHIYAHRAHNSYDNDLAVVKKQEQNVQRQINTLKNNIFRVDNKRKEEDTERKQKDKMLEQEKKEMLLEGKKLVLEKNKLAKVERVLVKQSDQFEKSHLQRSAQESDSQRQPFLRRMENDVKEGYEKIKDNVEKLEHHQPRSHAMSDEKRESSRQPFLKRIENDVEDEFENIKDNVEKLTHHKKQQNFSPAFNSDVHDGDTNAHPFLKRMENDVEEGFEDIKEKVKKFEHRGRPSYNPEDESHSFPSEKSSHHKSTNALLGGKVFEDNYYLPSRPRTSKPKHVSVLHYADERLPAHRMSSSSHPSHHYAEDEFSTARQQEHEYERANYQQGRDEPHFGHKLGGTFKQEMQNYKDNVRDAIKNVKSNEYLMYPDMSLLFDKPE